jgi:hypothetical protein
MDGPDTDIDPDGSEPPRRRRSRRRIAIAVILLAVALAFALAWGVREDIAGNVIASQLRQNGLEATYEIERIGPASQVLRNVVIGDPDDPDLTVERLEVVIRYRLGFPAIGRVTALRPRLYGTLRDGTLSFGSLDKVLFEGGDPDRPFRLPDLDLAIADGRGLIESDWGPIGVKLHGAGPLRDGFRGTLAAIMPQAGVGGCAVTRASLYGSARIAAERLRFEGPLRLTALSCPDGARLTRAAMRVEAVLDRRFDGGEAELALETGAAGFGDIGARQLRGTAKATYRRGSLTARYDLAAGGLGAAALAAGVLHTEGSLRSQNGLQRIELDGSLEAENLALGRDLDAGLVSAQRAAQGSLFAPMLAQIRGALAREAPGSRLGASYLARFTEEGTSVTVPQANLRGRSGATLLALSRFQLRSTGGAAPLLFGNLVTGGPGLPRIAGRMSREPGGDVVLRLAMAEYRAGEGRIAVPSLVLAQSENGAIGFAGQARLSGPLPGGSARDLVLPLDGNWSPRVGLAMWRKCTPVAFASLTYANLTLDRRSLTLCPQRGAPILRTGPMGTSFAAGAASLDLSGRLGATPIRITAGPTGFAVPGTLTARNVAVGLGPRDSAARFNLASLTARIGRDIAGSFSGTEMRLAAVPLDVLEAEGAWRYADGVLSIAEGRFRLIDRRADARFEPLDGRGARVTLRDNAIAADAVLTHPASGREVTTVAIRHDLGTGRGTADLAMTGVTFDAGLQPEALTRLALGVVANVRGTLRGEGHIAWNDDAVTSTGRFTTDDLDFAAAFGPVEGASGTLVFSDLLNLVSAPDQRLRVASVNPGIEVTNGELRYELRPGPQLAVLGGTWPFLDGMLTLEPTALNFGVEETRRYTLRVEGLNAAKFVERMELANISATGTFDGVLPLVFDEAGGRIEGGLLTSRPPGGNVSYVGSLTYEDLSTLANFAFEALKSLDYREMRIAVDGALTGEIVTRVRFDQVRQGAGAKRNLLTRSIANLPVRFNVNVRAPFYQLINSFKALYDPQFVKDPRTIGLLDAQGRPIAPSVTNPQPPAIRPQDIQPSVSE